VAQVNLQSTPVITIMHTTIHEVIAIYFAARILRICMASTKVAVKSPGNTASKRYKRPVISPSSTKGRYNYRLQSLKDSWLG
jgi:hypothetical protein